MSNPLEEHLPGMEVILREGSPVHSNMSTAVNCSCDMHPSVTDFMGLTICNAPLVPSWILAVVIGLTAASKFLHLGPNVTGSLSYAVTFAMYAAMMSSGLIVHCLYLVECNVQTPTKVFMVVAKIDLSLTSCIAFSFLLNGLVDINVIHERSWRFMLSSLVMYSTIFLAYFMNLAPVMLLYFATIVICCSLYLLCQLAAIIKRPCNFRAVLFVIAAGVFGGSSLWLVREKACWLCLNLGAWSIEGVWYYGSDVSMLFIALYVWSTRTKEIDTYGSKFEKCNSSERGGPYIQTRQKPK